MSLETAVSANVNWQGVNRIDLSCIDCGWKVAVWSEAAKSEFVLDEAASNRAIESKLGKAFYTLGCVKRGFGGMPGGSEQAARIWMTSIIRDLMKEATEVVDV